MYNHKEIEKKWQEKWANDKQYQAHDDSTKEKFYQLETFPYPSAAGLHVGHPKGYIAEDIHARFMRAQGKEVLYTMGWDAFGLPTENYAIKVGKNPKEVAAENIANFKRQVQMFGLSYDWDREINTSSPEYYKWTQWIFIQLYKKGLAYRAKAKVNWCPNDQTVLANEQVNDGKCDRCGTEVIQKEMEQWFLKITDYADRLVRDLETLDWPEPTKHMQRNWIGRSEGADIEFEVEPIKGLSEIPKIKVFTTRPDTIFGTTYMVLAPEHPLVSQITTKEQKREIEEYIKNSQSKTELERTALEKDKTGVFTGAHAINPATKDTVQIWIADYVLSTYGTGAIMAVPAHDERDYEFAKKFELPIVRVVNDEGDRRLPYLREGRLTNSGKYDTISSSTARSQMAKDFGTPTVQYRLRDWSVSRQRYWGVPIPMVHCQKCGIQPVAEKDLPIVLPDDVDFRPKGIPPLASSEGFINTTCPNCQGSAKRDPETLDTFVDSSWYFLRYTDPHNDKEIFEKSKVEHWMPVDLYVIGAEHATLHLLYSRFISKFLYDAGYLKVNEPFKKLRHLGLIMGADGQKMSKSKGNVVNPDEVVAEVGADAMRVYEMFMGPFDDGQPWNTKGLIGAKRFLDKIIKFAPEGEDKPQIHKLIKKITSDIPNFKFNTSIAAFMEFLNENKQISKANWETFLILLAPFAPHLTEELWSHMGHTDSIHLQPWPKFDEKLTQDKNVQIVVQVLGRVRATVEFPVGTSQDEVRLKVLADPNVNKHIEGKEIVKEVFVQDKLINFVIK